MILTTHAIVGAAAGRIFTNPFLAFVAGFASHFLADSIPHWDYHLNAFDPDKREKENKVFTREFAADAARFLPDLIIGIIAAIFIFRSGNNLLYSPVSLLAGILGGLLPDMLEMIYLKFHTKFLSGLSDFHNFIHHRTKLTPFKGLTTQVLTIIIVVILSKLTG